MNHRRATAKDVMFKLVNGRNMIVYAQWVCEDCGHTGKDTATSRNIVRHFQSTGHSHIRTSDWTAWELTEHHND